MDYELSVVLPCLNEEQGISVCIEKIVSVFKNLNISGEIIVVDNGSVDKSVEIVKKYIEKYPFIKLVFEPQKGYGSALRRGIEEAKGKYIIMGDADDTYDFLEIPKFFDLLRKGYDLVIGSRFKGKILPGAMTWSHKYIGNPILSGMLRLFFGGNISDAHCGLRGFSKEAYREMNLHTTGMEFASEMVIHALKKKLNIAEVPITYYPRKGVSKLASFRDAWRHIRFMLLYSPNYLFFLPGVILFLVGGIVSVRILLGEIYFLGRAWGVHVMVFSSLLTIVGWQILNFWFSAKVFTNIIGLEEGKITKKLLKFFTLEKMLIIGGMIFLCGIGSLGYILYTWAKAGFGPLEQVKTGIIAITLIAMGIQTIFASFLFSLLQIKYK